MVGWLTLSVFFSPNWSCLKKFVILNSYIITLQYLCPLELGFFFYSWLYRNFFGYRIVSWCYFFSKCKHFFITLRFQKAWYFFRSVKNFPYTTSHDIPVIKIKFLGVNSFSFTHYTEISVSANFFFCEKLTHLTSFLQTNLHLKNVRCFIFLFINKFSMENTVSWIVTIFYK